MKADVALKLKNIDALPITVVVEPWASELQLQSGDSFEIVETGGRLDRQIEVQVETGRVTLFAREGATMKIFANGVELF